jgi:hypothetical protein
MSQNERRKSPRVRVYDPIAYLSEDSEGKLSHRNVGVVRNVSKTGIRLETFQAVKSEKIVLMLFDLDKKQIEVEGEVIYCAGNDCGQYNVGINLVGTAHENRQFIKALVKSYHYQKKKTHLAMSPGLQN